MKNMAIVHGSPDSERRLLAKLPNEVQNLDDMGRVRSYFEQKHSNATGWLGRLRRWNYRRQIAKIDRGMKDPLRVGAAGEKGILNTLAVLDDRYHIFCDLHVRLPYTVRYRGNRNLRSAQMDLVVVCTRGVFMIEVKNWSDRYAEKPDWSPHEQTERAGQILWIVLKEAIDGIRVINVLLSMRGNLQYDPEYGSVRVSYPDKIVGFLTSRPDVLTQNDMARVLNRLEGL